MSQRRFFVLLTPLLVIISGFLLYINSDTQGNFIFADAPRHALNSILVSDILKNLIFFHPSELRDYAINYYLQYPALTILFYPPLSYAVTGIAMLIFGQTHATAQGVVIVFYIFLGLGAYKLSRHYFDRILSLIFALSLMFLPEMTIWGRQVMLEIPSNCFIIWASHFLLSYTEKEKPKHLYFSIFLIFCSFYTKISSIFMAPIFFIYLLATKKTDLFKDKHIWINGFLGTIAIIPLILLTYFYGKVNLINVSQDGNLDKLSLANWTYYLYTLADQISWPTIYLTLLCTILGGILYIKNNKHLSLKFTNQQVFLLIWLIVGYIYFSFISLKSARHTVFIFYPILYWCFWSIQFAMDQIKPKWIFQFIAGSLAIYIFYTGLILTQRPHVNGYREAVDYLSPLIPPNTNVLMSGYRDGNFIFDMRAYSGRPDVMVLRADKLLLRLQIKRSLGVEEKTYSQKEISELINQHRISYVLAQEDFWTDLDQMKKLDNILHSSQFEKVHEIIPTSNERIEEKKLIIYKNKAKLPEDSVKWKSEIIMIDEQFEQK